MAAWRTRPLTASGISTDPTPERAVTSPMVPMARPRYRARSPTPPKAPASAATSRSPPDGSAGRTTARAASRKTRPTAWAPAATPSAGARRAAMPPEKSPPPKATAAVMASGKPGSMVRRIPRRVRRREGTSRDARQCFTHASGGPLANVVGAAPGPALSHPRLARPAHLRSGDGRGDPLDQYQWPMAHPGPRRPMLLALPYRQGLPGCRWARREAQMIQDYCHRRAGGLLADAALAHRGDRRRGGIGGRHRRRAGRHALRPRFGRPERGCRLRAGEPAMYLEAKFDLPDAQRADLRALIERFPGADADQLLGSALADTLDRALSGAPFDYFSPASLPGSTSQVAVAVLDLPASTDPVNPQIPATVAFFGTRDPAAATSAADKVAASSRTRASASARRRWTASRSGPWTVRTR